MLADFRRLGEQRHALGFARDSKTPLETGGGGVLAQDCETERMKGVDRKPFGVTEAVSFERLRINHYYVKSEEQWVAKRTGRRANSERSRELPSYKDTAFTVRDETILAYAPALREAVGATPVAEGT